MTTIEQQLQPHQYLAGVLPEVLAEGPVLIEFKTAEDTGIKPSAIVTLHPEDCPLENKPEDTDPTGETLWCWDAPKGEWVLLDLKEVETAQVWPPQLEENAAFDRAETE